MQQVSTTDVTNIRGYETHHNIGTSMRVTAILTKRGITLTNITKIPSERAITAEYRGTLLVNVSAPSGTAKRNEREHFYNTELPYLLRTTLARMILGETLTAY